MTHLYANISEIKLCFKQKKNLLVHTVHTLNADNVFLLTQNENDPQNMLSVAWRLTVNKDKMKVGKKFPTITCMYG